MKSPDRKECWVWIVTVSTEQENPISRTAVNE